MKHNEGYVNLISDFLEENKELWLQVKNIEELHRNVILSQRNQQERHTLFKALAKNVKYKSPASSNSKVVADATIPSS